MQALLAVESDGGAALQEYLEKEHIECQNAKDGSTLLPEAMRARARVPRCVPLPVPRDEGGDSEELLMA